METQASKFCIFPEDMLFSWCVEGGLVFLCDVSEGRGGTQDQGHLKSFALYRGCLRSPGSPPSNGHPLLSACLPALSPAPSPLLIALSQTLTWMETFQLNQRPCRPPKLRVGHLSWHLPTFLIPPTPSPVSLLFLIAEFHSQLRWRPLVDHRLPEPSKVQPSTLVEILCSTTGHTCQKQKRKQRNKTPMKDKLKDKIKNKDKFRNWHFNL